MPPVRSHEALATTDQRVWMPELNLGLGVWQGEYRSVRRQWLRWYDAQSDWILTDAEQGQQRTQQAEQRAEQERQRAEQAEQRAQRIRNLGID